MKMRRSRTLELLRAGKIVMSMKLNTMDARVTEMAAMAGFPCIWVDMEHTPNDYAVTENQIRAGKIYDTDVLVRVPRGSYSDYIRPLELDASGIMVPHVMSVEDAKRVVHMTRYYPIGRRPLDGGNADGMYGNVENYTTSANENRFIIFQIEDPEALEQIEEIAQVPGYDMLFFGPGDFSHSIGVPGQCDHPDVQAGYRKVAEAARKYGKFAGTVADPWEVPDLLKMGYQFLNLGADVEALNTYFQKTAKFALESGANQL